MNLPGVFGSGEETLLLPYFKYHYNSDSKLRYAHNHILPEEHLRF
jgi:hypothetical protein